MCKVTVPLLLNALSFYVESESAVHLGTFLQKKILIITKIQFQDLKTMYSCFTGIKCAWSCVLMFILG